MATVAPAPFADLGGYGNPSAALSFNGNPNIGGSGNSYGVVTPNTSYGTTPMVLGTSTGPTNTTPYGPTNPGNSGSGASSPAPQQQSTAPGPGQPGYINPNTIPGTPEYYANNLSINTGAYDQAVRDLQGFIPIIQQQGQTATDAVNNSVNDTVNSANQQGQTIQNQGNQAIAAQEPVLRSALGGNNAYAASFGSGLSSFGEGLNNQTYQNYGNTVGGIQNNVQSGLQQVGQWINSAKTWGANQIAGIQNGVQQALQQVALNVDQTDMQKANMVSQIQMQAQQQMNQINGIVAQLQANIAAAQQNNLTYAAMYAQQSPQLAANISNLANTFAQQGNRGVNTVFPGMPGMYGSSGYNKLYGSNTSNQNPYLNFGSTNG